MHTSDDAAELFMALAKAQAEMAGAVKEASNPFFKNKYADLSSIIRAIKEPLMNHDIGYSQHPYFTNGNVGVITLVFHKSGQWMESTLEMPLVKGDPQAVGSAITYARRYQLAAIFGVPVADDDANAAVFRTAPDGHEGDRSDLAKAVEKGDFEAAARLWIAIGSKEEKTKVFMKLPREVKTAMQSAEFAKACETLIQKPKTEGDQ